MLNRLEIEWPHEAGLNSLHLPHLDRPFRSKTRNEPAWGFENHFLHFLTNFERIGQRPVLLVPETNVAIFVQDCELRLFWVVDYTKAFIWAVLLYLEVLEAELVRFYPDVLYGVLLPDLSDWADWHGKRRVRKSWGDNGTILVEVHELD